MKKIIFIAIFLVGACLFCYPYLNGFIGDEMMEHSITEFKDSIVHLKRTEIEAFKNEEKTDLLQSLFEEMKQYNNVLYENKQANLVDPFSYEQSSFDLTKYGFDENIIGVISIPKMKSELPIYLGASAQNLNKGAVHLSETSLPLGGENTNTVLAAHRGWRGKTLFKNIDWLTYGDEVVITNLWENLTYRVVDIEIVMPDEITKVLIQEGRELLTLVTCHPYGENSHRYIVYLERVQ